MGTRCADHVTPLYPQELALTSPTGGCRSVGIVRSRTKATEFSFLVQFFSVNIRENQFRCYEVPQPADRTVACSEMSNNSISPTRMLGFVGLRSPTTGSPKTCDAVLANYVWQYRTKPAWPGLPAYHSHRLVFVFLLVGDSPASRILYADVSERCPIFICGVSKILLITPHMMMEETGCSDASILKIQTPRYHPQERTQRSEHSESVKSSLCFLF